MSFEYINEAFKRLDLLEEEYFDLSDEGVQNLSNMLNQTDDTVRVIDPEATTSDDLSDSYVGKVIANCNICHSNIFKNKEDIAISEEGIVNEEDTCPYCGESEGFTIVGEIAPYSAETSEEDDEQQVDTAAEIEVDEVETTATDSEEASEEDELTYESLSSASRRVIDRNETLSEDFKEVSIKTDDQHLEMTSDENGKITVVSEPVTSDMSTEDAETIVPVSDETTAEIIDNNSDTVEEEPTEEDYEEIDFDEIDNDGFDELGESYFKTVYENVNSFKTTDVAASDNTMIVEGILTFNSGTKKSTGFVFESAEVNKNSKIRFKGYNKHIAEGADSFSLVGVVDNKKLFVESLKYNYTVGDQTVRGVAKRR